MNELLSNPLFQSGVAPFVVSLLLGLSLYRTIGLWAGIAVVAGFYATAWLVTDLKFFPLTSTRKILLLGVVALAVGLLFDLYRSAPRWLLGLFFAAGCAAAAWMVWPVFVRQEGWESWLMVAFGSGYVGWLLASLVALRDQPERVIAALLALAGGTGISVLLGASALLGQLASAIAAALAGYLLAGLFSSRLVAGGLLVVPVALLCGLMGLAETAVVCVTDAGSDSRGGACAAATGAAILVEDCDVVVVSGPGCRRGNLCHLDTGR